MEMWVL